MLEGTTAAPWYLPFSDGVSKNVVHGIVFSKYGKLLGYATTKVATQYELFERQHLLRVALLHN